MIHLCKHIYVVKHLQWVKTRKHSFSGIHVGNPDMIKCFYIAVLERNYI